MDHSLQASVPSSEGALDRTKAAATCRPCCSKQVRPDGFCSAPLGFWSPHAALCMQSTHSFAHCTRHLGAPLCQPPRAAVDRGRRDRTPGASVHVTTPSTSCSQQGQPGPGPANDAIGILGSSEAKAHQKAPSCTSLRGPPQQSTPDRGLNNRHHLPQCWRLEVRG